MSRNSNKVMEVIGASSAALVVTTVAIGVATLCVVTIDWCIDTMIRVLS